MSTQNQSSTNSAEASGEFTWKLVEGSPHATGCVTYKDGTFLASTPSPEDAQRIAEALNRSGQEKQLTWPKERDVGRYGDMSQYAHLRVGLDSDNDVYVSVWDEEGGASVEFCQPGGGGGKSSRTRLALIALMHALEADNANTPHLDWWARRQAQAPQ